MAKKIKVVKPKTPGVRPVGRKPGTTAKVHTGRR